MTYTQTVLTFISRVEPHAVEDLARLLASIADNLADNPYVPFPALGSLHFASFVILPDETYGPYLVFENNFDGPLEAYLETLIAVAGPGLEAIYRHCLDYPGSAAPDPARLCRYLRDHAVRPTAYHVGNPGRSLARIQHEANLRRTIESWLDDLVPRGQASPTPHDLRQHIQDLVRVEAAWAVTAPPRQSLPELLLPRLKLTAAGLLVLAALPFGLIWLAVLRYKERHDLVAASPPSDDHIGALLDNENRKHVVQNHMASITFVKPGLFRRLTLRLTLLLMNLIARCRTNGELSGIPSIHFAHWSLIDGGRRLLFLSNFDGSWENYLDDFIDKASRGLTAIWSNTVGFPRTEFLVRGGARDGTRFKAIARQKQVFTNVWYSAYPDLTVTTINANSTIREDLFKNLSTPEVRRWLWRF